MAESKDRAPQYEAQKARQGEIILRHRWSRTIFIAGIVGIAVVAIVLALA